MTEKPLDVCAIDDNEDDLYFLRRLLEKIPGRTISFRGFSDVDEGLTKLAIRPPDLVFLDFYIEGRTGLDILEEIRGSGVEAPVILLTGQGNERIAVEAMKGGAADYIPKGALTSETLQRAVVHAREKDRLRKSLEEHKRSLEETNRELVRLVDVERQLITQTLYGSLDALTHVLALVNPKAFGRSTRVKRYVSAMARAMGHEDIWTMEIAALLSQLGCVTLPPEILTKVSQGKDLTRTEAQLYREHPRIAAELIKDIPRMEQVADIIAQQDHQPPGSGVPADQAGGKDIPLGARLLKAALDFDTLESAGLPKTQALVQIKARGDQYDPAVIKALEAVCANEHPYRRATVSLNDLAQDMILAEDVKTESGSVVVPKGQTVSLAMLVRLQNFQALQRIQEPLAVLISIVTLQEELAEQEIGHGPSANTSR
ncbi:MAG: HD domain-containing phosphohydrolase [Nitrospirales bacterium]